MTRGQLNRRCAIALCAAIVAAAAAGCGSGGGTHPVSLSLLAPTDGATISVRSIEVIGHVSPRNAIVSVSGHRVTVQRGAFRQPLTLSGSVSHITVAATASGYARSTVPITVHYTAPAVTEQAGSTTQQTTSAPGSKPPPSVASVTTRANKLCAIQNNAVSAQPAITSTTVAGALTQDASLTGSLIEKLRSVAKTAPNQSELDRFAGGLEAEAADAGVISSDLSAGRSSSAQSILAQEQVLGQQAYGEAIALKLPECGEAALMIGPSGAEIAALDSQQLSSAVQQAKSSLSEQLQRAKSQLAHALQQVKSQKAAHSSK